MRQIRKRIFARLIFFIRFCTIPAGLLLCGCGQQEITKIIALPELESKEESSGIAIKDLRKYVYDGHTEDMLWMSWGESGSDIAYMLHLEEQGYMYQKIDVKTKQILNETFVDDRVLSNVHISPGGRYIAYEVEAYEAEEESSLILFIPENGKKLVLCRWKGSHETYSYTWSADGTKLFSWQNGDDYEKEPDADWSVTCYSIQAAKANDEEKNRVVKNEISMKSKGYAWRSVLPNKDGSKVYVREEYETFSDSKKAEKRVPLPMAEEKISAGNWLLTPETHEKKKLPEYSEEAVNPVKYTKAGLYFRNEEGNLMLVENIEKKSAAKELFNTVNKETYICEDGDHIFLIEWRDNMESLQLSGIRMVKGNPSAKQTLYKEAYQNTEIYLNADDTAIVIWGSEYLGEDRYSFKITELEYGARHDTMKEQ